MIYPIMLRRRGWLKAFKPPRTDLYGLELPWVLGCSTVTLQPIDHVQYAEPEVLPHVYTSSSISQNNPFSFFGAKYLLPIGTTREYFEVCRRLQAWQIVVVTQVGLRRSYCPTCENSSPTSTWATHLLFRVAAVSQIILSGNSFPRTHQYQLMNL